MRPLSVLVIHNRYQQPGGEDTVVRAEVDLLRRHGHRVSEYVRDNAAIEGFSRLQRAGLLFSASWNHRVYRELRGLIRRQRPDIAHCHNLMPLISPAAHYACRAERVPVVQTVHNFRLGCPAGTYFHKGAICTECASGNLLRPLLRDCYRESHAQTAAATLTVASQRALGKWTDAVHIFLAPSRFCRDALVAGGLAAGKVRVKPNFVPRDPGQRQGVGDYAIFAGRLSAEKGILALLRAWWCLPDIPLLVVGGGPLFGEAQALIAKLGMQQVTLCGRLPPDETMLRIRRARFLVCASQCFETFGMSVLEAAACGVPALAPQLGALPELVEHGRTGLLFDSCDPDDLITKADWAWSHPKTMQAMGTAARGNFLRKYTAERNYDELLGAYDSVLSAVARRRAPGLAPEKMPLPADADDLEYLRA